MKLLTSTLSPSTSFTGSEIIPVVKKKMNRHQYLWQDVYCTLRKRLIPKILYNAKWKECKLSLGEVKLEEYFLEKV